MKSKEEESRVEILQGEITTERDRKIALEEKLAAASQEREEAAAKQQDIAYRALSTNDRQLRQELESAEEVLARTGQRVESIRVALRCCEDKLAGLLQQQAKAFRQAKTAE